MKNKILLDEYDTALICLNGHLINDSKMNESQLNQYFCEKCGEKAIEECQNCNCKIKGSYWYEDSYFIIRKDDLSQIPSYCHNCGKAFPWLQKSFEAVEELLETEDIDIDDKKSIINSINEITKETSKTESSVLKIKKFATKIGSDTYDAIYKIAIDISSEMARKAFLGQ